MHRAARAATGGPWFGMPLYAVANGEVIPEKAEPDRLTARPPTGKGPLGRPIVDHSGERDDGAHGLSRNAHPSRKGSATSGPISPPEA
ncbi:hypothetical protein [Streptomyces sp. TLI_146]|uniref:hypothetical protein n=1 Tax=Streptomyces sp. TLI_146 TaxID=1938858 RepID=UPI00117D5457|nr:hypothetical protein [Streptomyces sp. TLI_146]